MPPGLRQKLFRLGSGGLFRLLVILCFVPTAYAVHVMPETPTAVVGSNAGFVSLMRVGDSAQVGQPVTTRSALLVIRAGAADLRISSLVREDGDPTVVTRTVAANQAASVVVPLGTYDVLRDDVPTFTLVDVLKVGDSSALPYGVFLCLFCGFSLAWFFFSPLEL